MKPFRILGWGAAASLLALPLIAMQFTDEVDWNVGDFIVMGALFAAAGGAIELGVRISANLAWRAGFVVAVGTSFLLVWVNLAVGIIGSEDNPANLMYLGVIGLFILGAVTAFGRARGMALAAAAAALATVLAGAVAAFAGWGGDGTSSIKILGLTAFFGLPWLVSAALFHAADRTGAGGSAGR
jgi:hypothetical protein